MPDPMFNMMSKSYLSLPVEEAEGFFFVADPHVADTPVGQRLSGYREQILEKIRACLGEARARNLCPVFLGDLFNWPRDNSNSLLIELMELFRPYKPWVLVGNHDKYQARFTSDVSLSVLKAAGVINLMSDVGPQFVLHTSEGDVLLGASPDGTDIPKIYEREDGCPETVFWVSHHNVSFPDFPDKKCAIKEISGVDWLVNGHIHRPQPTLKKGMTTWTNPGNISRVAFSQRSKERKPEASFWKHGFTDLKKWEVPHLPFEEVFPDQDFPDSVEPTERSKFIDGLERLSWRKTQEGTGLKQFLEENLEDKAPASELIWQLYNEVIDNDK
ncbi:MAG: metallophosphoesterase [Desulfovibrio sp.]